ncbi:hypothetical protein [Pedobacter sp. SL55]|uniref:hypothetical protein n=1 Tax=Pedobacter sp. SL55 TaxID=2995161 RepID=UPI00226F0F75|nr:hypothetical protein [Pedobacter sp. SL55]WAC41634.1 hypothetical protein OVA16_04530 [Pedobacter sp. SL55]
MEILKPLTDFFSSIEKDGRISVTHIAVYTALLKYWQQSGFTNPLQAFSYQIMEIAKISAPMTYRKCLKDLSDFGYLKYQPSHKSNQASKIILHLPD